MWTTTRYIFITALRDKLFSGLAVAVVVIAAIALLLGSTAFLEEHAMTLVLTAGAVRILLVTGIIVFVCFHVRQSFEHKDMDVLLSRPISRGHLLVSFWIGFWVTSICLSIPVLAILVMMGVENWTGYMGWSVSLLLELALVVALALFSALSFRSAVTAVIGCLGFYMLSRMMTFFVMTSESVMAGQDKIPLLKEVLSVISMIIPRLDLFTQSQWLVYGIPQIDSWVIVVVQATIFVPLLLWAALIDFRRREF